MEVLAGSNVAAEMLRRSLPITMGFERHVTMKLRNDSMGLKATVVAVLALGVGILSYRNLGQSPARAEIPGPSPFDGNNNSKSLRAQLGKALFFDTNLSTPTGQSCGSC